MSKIPTAEDFFIQKGFMPNHHKLGYDIKTAMIEFAKLHNNAQVTVVDYNDGGFNSTPDPIYGVDSDSILNAYPLENIK